VSRHRPTRPPTAPARPELLTAAIESGRPPADPRTSVPAPRSQFDPIATTLSPRAGSCLPRDLGKGWPAVGGRWTLETHSAAHDAERDAPRSESTWSPLHADHEAARRCCSCGSRYHSSRDDGSGRPPCPSHDQRLGAHGSLHDPPSGMGVGEGRSERAGNHFGPPSSLPLVPGRYDSPHERDLFCHEAATNARYQTRARSHPQIEPFVTVPTRRSRPCSRQP
jgi:hypothetical protein